MVDFNLLFVGAGLVYGYLRPGRENKIKILKNGLRWGFFLGVLFGLFTLIVGGFGVGLAAGTVGGVIFLVIALKVSVLFIVGVMIGDFLEGVIKK